MVGLAVTTSTNLRVVSQWVVIVYRVFVIIVLLKSGMIFLHLNKIPILHSY